MALPAAGDLFKSTFDEPLKKLLQPVGIVPALVLAGLNLVFFFPTLLDAKVPLVVAFSDLDAGWQLGLTSLMALVLGVLIVSFAPALLRIATGESWQTSMLRDVFVDRQLASLKNLAERPADTNSEQHARDLELKTRFPVDPLADPLVVEEIAPTALGNALSAITYGVWKSYGLDMTATWTQMRETVRKESEKMLGELDDDESGFLTLLNVAGVLVLFAIEGLVLSLALGTLSFLVPATLAMGAAFVAYLSAVGRVLTWGDRVAAAYDLYRRKLRDALGTGKATTPAGELIQNRQLSTALAWDSPTQDYAKNEEGSQVVLTSPTLSGSILDRGAIGPVSSASGDRAEVSWLVGYVLEIRGTDPDNAASGFVDVIDRELPRRLPNLPVAAAGDALNAAASIIHRSDIGLHDRLRWQVAQLAAKAVLQVDYRLVWQAELSAPGNATKPSGMRWIEGNDDIRGWDRLALEMSYPRTRSNLRLVLRDDRLPKGRPLRATYRVQGVDPVTLTVASNDGRWVLTGKVELGVGRLEVFKADE